MTSFMVDNIHEIEPVVKKEVPALPREVKEDEKDDQPQHDNRPDDPAQMKLEL
jgi:hypothetical protein